MTFTPFPILSTNRLSLRQLKAKDAQEIFSLRSDQQVNKYLERHPCIKIEEAWAFIHKINAGILQDNWIYWAICKKGEERLIGTICLWNISYDQYSAELGFELLPAFQKQGIMQESLEAVFDFCCEKPALKTLVAYSHPNNQDSIRLLLKNGFIEYPSEPSLDPSPHLTMKRSVLL